MDLSDPAEVTLKGIPKWGKYQILAYISLGYACIFCVNTMGYILIARDIKYRCLIPECEDVSNSTYKPAWLNEFLPFKGDSPDSCHRYALTNNSCSGGNVLRNEILKCSKFVYQSEDVIVVHDFGIHCEENIWKLTIVGTISMCGELVCLAYSGFISDKYGRKTLIIISMLLSTIAGILKSLSVSYVMYVIMEFLDTAVAAGLYNAAFILAMEFVAPKHRNIANIAICCLFAAGQSILGLAAWLTPSWRIMLRVLYTPGFVSILFFWTIPESIRWLLSKNKLQEIEKILNRLKGAKDSTENLALMKYLQSFAENQHTLLEQKTTNAEGKFSDALKSKSLFVRLIHCSCTWISCTFLYYGLTMNSVSLSNNIYVSFILTTAVEIPAYIIYYFANQKIGRRWMTSFGLISTGVTCLTVGFIPKEITWLKMIFYLIGKCCATIAYTVVYVYTTEMFPTSSRHSMLSVCAMVSRLGSMVAPQIPLLARVWETLPLILFAIIGSVAGILALLFPETLNTKLPDTIQEAINIGKRQKRNTQQDPSSTDSLE